MVHIGLGFLKFMMKTGFLKHIPIGKRRKIAMDKKVSRFGKFLCFIGIHDWQLIYTERRKIRLFKKLYEVNNWNENYKVCTYECSRCKEREVNYG